MRKIVNLKIVMVAFVGMIIYASSMVVPTPAHPIYAGVRWSDYGCGNEPYCQTDGSAGFFISTANQMSEKFIGSSPSIIYILGSINGNPGTTESTQLNFPHSPVTNVIFSQVDMNEAQLDAMDNAGIKYWLQVEPESADVNTLIDLVLTQYASHSSNIIGIGIDAEWYNDFEYKSGGRPITDQEVTSWIEKVKTYNQSYKLFIKHFNYGNLPPTARPNDVAFITDSEEHTSYDNGDVSKSLIPDYVAWANHFKGSEIGYQIGYESDKKLWSVYPDPATKIYNDIKVQVPSALITNYFWVDFTVKDEFQSVNSTQT